ncbi:hypothetical protein [Streptomyces sp. NPDC127038]|uniref:hypothetical protein n=1 Tax=Streptomyces sp. NPDC127038 TaxID=3347114 RepID=UPI0036610A37
MTNRETPQAADTRPGRRTALTRPPAQRTASEAAEGPAPVDDGWIRVTPLNRAMPAPARRGAPGPDARDTPAVRTPTAGMGATLAEARKRADAALARTGTAPDRAAKSWAPATGSVTATRGTAADTTAEITADITAPGKTVETGTAPTAPQPQEGGAEAGSEAPEVTEGVPEADATAAVDQPREGGAEAGSEAPEATAGARGTESVLASARKAETEAGADNAEATGDAREPEARTGTREPLVTAEARRAETRAPAPGNGTGALGATGPRKAETGPRSPEAAAGTGVREAARRADAPVRGIVPAARAAGGRGSAYAPGGDETAPLPLRTVRGRHRKPRRRRVLFAVGGLALAAGVLSLTRMTPDAVTGGTAGGNTEADPVATATDNDPAGHAAPTVAAMPTPTVAGAAPASPAMGGTSPAPTSDPDGIPAPVPTSATTVPAARSGHPATAAPGTTGIPTAPVTTAPAARPTPAASPTAEPPRHTPSPAPSASTPPHQQPGVCVPIVGICVNGLLSPGQDDQ